MQTLPNIPHSPTGWLRLSQLPICETLARQLIKDGLLQGVIACKPGSTRGVRLVSQESFNAYLKTLPTSLPRVGGKDGGGPNLGRKKKQTVAQ
jgi:hypothetical protein